GVRAVLPHVVGAVHEVLRGRLALALGHLGERGRDGGGRRELAGPGRGRRGLGLLGLLLRGRRGLVGLLLGDGGLFGGGLFGGGLRGLCLRGGRGGLLLDRGLGLGLGGRGLGRRSLGLGGHGVGARGLGFRCGLGVLAARREHDHEEQDEE